MLHLKKSVSLTKDFSRSMQCLVTCCWTDFGILSGPKRTFAVNRRNLVDYENCCTSEKKLVLRPVEGFACPLISNMSDLKSGEKWIETALLFMLGVKS